jgi:hypothetical protein
VLSEGDSPCFFLLHLSILQFFRMGYIRDAEKYCRVTEPLISFPCSANNLLARNRSRVAPSIALLS